MSPTSSSRFQSRHIGPDADERDAMLKVVGASSLDALIDEAIPARIRLDEAARTCPTARASTSSCASCAASPRSNQVVPVVHRPRLLRLRHAERHPAERAREPRLVHAVHAVSGRDRAGPPRSAPQLPDDGARPDRDGGRERVAARRGDRRRRGDDDAASRAGEADRRRRRRRRSFSSPTRAFRRRSTCCGRAPNRSGSSCVVGDAERRSTFGDRVFGALVQTPDEAGRVHDLRGVHRARASRPACSSPSAPICSAWRC